MKKTKLKYAISFLALIAVFAMPLSNQAFAKEESTARKPAAAPVAMKVDINKAGLEELESIKGIGPALAERIVAYRNENGKFKTVQDITSVKGIGQSKFERIKDQLIIS